MATPFILCSMFKNSVSAITIAVSAVILMTSCNMKPENCLNETESVTEETSVTIVKPSATSSYTDEMLPMSIDEVAEALLQQMGEDAFILSIYDPSSEYYIDPEEYKDNNSSYGIINIISVGSYTEEAEGEYDTELVEIDIYEFDMDSEEYKGLSVGDKFSAYVPYGGGLECTEIVTAINHQYVITVYAALGQEGELEDDMPAESEPPYTISGAKAAYDTFLALE